MDLVFIFLIILKLDCILLPHVSSNIYHKIFMGMYVMCKCVCLQF